MSTVAIRLQAPVAASTDEDGQRADLYALLARLWQRAPDAAVLAGLSSQASTLAADRAARIEAGDRAASPGALADAWEALCRSAAETSPARVADEYLAAFGGVGRPEVFLHASYYQAGFLHERPLADLRAHLARLGLARRADRAETEDHVAMLCETMRYLIRSGDATLSSLPVQREFFHARLAGWIDGLADAVQAAPSTGFYKSVARLMRAFVEVERQAFDLE